MIYSLLVLSSPCSGQTSATAAKFAVSVLARGHSIHRVFFLDDGVFAGASSLVLPQDESSTVERWVELHDRHSIDLVLCVSSALKRGLVDSAEAKRYELESATAHPAFEISGMGQLVDTCNDCDRLITFGG
ncbi:MAG: tRNA 2-thiouridine synthesizing protein D [Halioglobus sp.]|jgi:tRNA 2-thiouridine synthesizing protein D